MVSLAQVFLLVYKQGPMIDMLDSNCFYRVSVLSKSTQTFPSISFYVVGLVRVVMQSSA